MHLVNQFRRLELGGSELVLRVCSALVLAPVAIAAAYLGRWWFAAFWAVAALGTFWEWNSLIRIPPRRSVLAIGGSTLVLAVALAAGGHVIGSLGALATGTVATAALTPVQTRLWLAAGTLYSGSVAVTPIMLRGDPEYGFISIIFLFAVVWGTDIVAYFFGRAIGGAKLLPQVSPKKTWSGAIAGTAAAIIAGIIVARAAGIGNSFAIAALAAVLSIVAQGGDLLEILPETQVWREGLQPAHPRAWRSDGSFRRLCRRRPPRRPYRHCAGRAGGAGSRFVGMVTR